MQREDLRLERGIEHVEEAGFSPELDTGFRAKGFDGADRADRLHNLGFDFCGAFHGRALIALHRAVQQPNAAGNPQWNMSQMPKGDPIEKSFHDPEVMMPFKCNQHPWMKAYVNVASNPFYAVSDANGMFAIKGLPPGEYTIAAVHEARGEQTQQISVGAKENKAADFTFAAQ